MREQLLIQAVAAAIRAGRATIEIYRTAFSVTHKSDESPLTLADRRSHEIIMDVLKPIGLPILSEEGRHIPFSERKTWKTFWMVDPLDGTKEFVNRNDEFTVNIALVEAGEPVLGVINVPVGGATYFAEKTIGAFKLEDPSAAEKITAGEMESTAYRNGETLRKLIEKSRRLPLAAPPKTPYTIVGSRSHATPELSAFVEDKRLQYGQVDFISAGSSLKFCQVAEGRASIYPRLGPTMEWDTAAGQAIAVCAGARVVRHDTSSPLVYNKETLLNPSFLVEWPD